MPLMTFAPSTVSLTCEPTDVLRSAAAGCPFTNNASPLTQETFSFPTANLLIAPLTMRARLTVLGRLVQRAFRLRDQVSPIKKESFC